MPPPRRALDRVSVLRRCCAPGFTLIELLTSIAIIAILSGISFGVVRGAKERSRLQQARAELSLLAQALEDYKRHYGDYPQTGLSAANAQRVTPAANGVSAGPGLATVPARLFNALIGVYGPTDFVARLSGPVFVDVTRLTMEVPFTSSTQTTTNNPTTFAVPTGTPPAKPAQNNSFVDPWGNRYLYFYYARGGAAAWRAPAYVLYSTGPDGASTILPSASGVFTGTNQTTGDNSDNLYADKLQ